MAPQPRKQLLVDTAFKLFNEHGYHAMGIDGILKESGVSKATLYKHFPSKDALIIGVLEQRHSELLNSMEQCLKQAEGSIEFPVLAIFDALEHWFNSEDFFGCNFIQASAEYSEANCPIHLYAAKHKESVKTLLAGYLGLNKLNHAQRLELADKLLIIIDGTIIAAQVRGDKQAAETARAIAGILLASV